MLDTGSYLSGFYLFFCEEQEELAQEPALIDNDSIVDHNITVCILKRYFVTTDPFYFPVFSVKLWLHLGQVIFIVPLFFGILILALHEGQFIK